jgi:ABC-type branched-subunit amino acid transport system substrate-binding protein
MDNYALAAVLLAALLTVLVVVFRRITRPAVQKFVEQHSPAALQQLLVWAALTAYDAVEQMADAYESMTSEQKQELAVKLIQSLLKAFGVPVPAAAACAVLEREIYVKRLAAHQPAPTLADEAAK